MNKRRLITAAFFTGIIGSLFFADAVSAQGGFKALAPITGLTSGITANADGLATFFNSLYIYLIGIASALAVVEIIWGGLEISTQDSVSKKSDGKKRIQDALMGLVLVLSPAIVFSIINPSILNLSLNIPKLDIHTAKINTAPSVSPACAGFTQIKIVRVPTNKYCRDVLGDGWVEINKECSKEQAPLGYAVCGLESSESITNVSVSSGINTSLSASSVAVVYYAPAAGIGVPNTNAGAVVPSQKQTRDSFYSQCNTVGGAVRAIIGNTTSCPPNSGIGIQNSLTNAGDTAFVCYNETLVCEL